MKQSRYTLRKMAHIVFAMGWMDFVLKYRGSFLGYIWSFMAPLSKFLVIYHIFSRYTDQAIESYALYLLIGLVFWEFFAQVTSGCITVLFSKSAIIQKITFPRYLLSLAVGWQNLIILGTHVVILLIFLLWMGIPLSLSSLYAVVVLVQLFLVAIGVGMAISAFTLRFRDIQHLWEVLLHIFFWLTPIVYLPEIRERFSLTLGSVFSLLIRYQPLSIIMQDARNVLLYTSTAGMPSAQHIVLITLCSGIIFVVGFKLFVWRSAWFVQEY